MDDKNMDICLLCLRVIDLNKEKGWTTIRLGAEEAEHFLCGKCNKVVKAKVKAIDAQGQNWIRLEQ